MHADIGTRSSPNVILPNAISDKVIAHIAVLYSMLMFVQHLQSKIILSSDSSKTLS